MRVLKYSRQKLQWSELRVIAKAWEIDQGIAKKQILWDFKRLLKEQ